MNRVRDQTSHGGVLSKMNLESYSWINFYHKTAFVYISSILLLYNLISTWDLGYWPREYFTSIKPVSLYVCPFQYTSVSPLRILLSPFIT